MYQSTKLPAAPSTHGASAALFVRGNLALAEPAPIPAAETALASSKTSPLKLVPEAPHLSAGSSPFALGFSPVAAAVAAFEGEEGFLRVLRKEIAALRTRREITAAEALEKNAGTIVHHALDSGEEGLEVYSPKEAIRMAGRLKMIDNVETWLNFLEDRNLAVHDYLGVSDKDYLQTVQAFLNEVKKLSIQ